MMVAIHRVNRTMLALIAALLIVLAVDAVPAQASVYSVWSCTDRFTDTATSAKGDWFSFLGGYGNNCPEGLEFWSGNDLQYNNDWFWQWTHRTGDGGLKKVTFTMRGGDTTGGLVYQLAETPSSDAFATLPSRSPTDGPLTTTVNIPPGINSITFRAHCGPFECSGSSHLVINEIKFLLDDSTPPTTSMLTEPSLNFDASGATTGPVPWYRSISLPIGIGAEDSGSGIKTASVQLDDADPLWSVERDCFTGWEFMGDEPPAIVYEKPEICTGEMHPPKFLDLRGISEGRHKLTSSATDALGHVSAPVSGWFGVDDTPPAAPKNLHFEDTPVNKYGWTTSGGFTARSDYEPDQGPNAAPIDGAPDGLLTRDDGGPGTPKKFSLHYYAPATAFPSEGHYRVEAWDKDKAGNRGYSSPIYIGYDTNRPPPPVLDENEWVSGKQLLDGYRQTWDQLIAPSYLEAGICGFIVAFDDQPEHTLSGEATIEGNVDSAPVPANLAEGPKFSHVATVSCAGLVSDTADTPLSVDATDPYVTIDGLSQNEWARQPLHLALTPNDDLSGPDSFDWSLDGAPAATETSATDLEVGDGEHVLTTSARDNAGNISDPSSTVIRVDSTAPVSWLGPATGGRPNDFTATVKDPVSGDDSALPDGTYELRVAAVDRAGNLGFGSALPAGGTVQVKLPLRARPTIGLAISDLVRRCSSKAKRGCATEKRCRRGARCTFRWVATKKGAGIDRIIDWGDRTALTGTVLKPDGSPVAGARVSIFSTPRGGSRGFEKSVTTDGDGSFEWRIPNGTSRSFAASTGATPEFASSETAATLAVRAGLAFSVSDRTPRPGQDIKLTGRLLSGGVGVPAGGKTIKLEYWRDGTWAPVFGSPPTDGSGRFHYTWHVPRSSSAGTLFLRARAESQATETDWPFEDGKSPSVRVEIHR
jgi:hypothetical protein